MAASGKPRGKGKNEPGKVYSKSTYRILQKTELMLLHASVFLQVKGEPIHSLQAMVEDAATKYVELLKKKYGVPFPNYLTGDSKGEGDSSKTSQALSFISEQERSGTL